MATGTRARLQWCDECNRDYPANQFHQSAVTRYPQPVTGWVCPKGHTTWLCDEGQHDKRSEDGLNWECSRCYASGLILSTCPQCGSSSLVLITPSIPGPNGWARRCKACGHRWDIADEA